MTLYVLRIRQRMDGSQNANMKVMEEVGELKIDDEGFWVEKMRMRRATWMSHRSF